MFSLEFPLCAFVLEQDCIMFILYFFFFSPFAMYNFILQIVFVPTS